MKRIQFIGIILIMWTTAFSVQNLADLSSEDWREDIEYLEERLISIHPNPFFRIDREVFQASIKALEQGLDELSWYEIYTRLTEIVASIGDGHTVVYPQGSSTLYPIYTYWFSDGLYVIATSESEQRLLNSKVLEISGTKVDDALKALRRVVSHDNEWGFMNSLSDYLNKPEIMMGLGLADKEGNLVLKIENNGAVSEVLVKPQNAGFQWVQKRIEEIDRTYIGRKYWYQYYPDSRILHFHYASCGSEERNPFILFNCRMFLFTWTNPVDKFVLDLRGNGGGSSVILEPDRKSVV